MLKDVVKKKGLTLVETLLVVMISGLVMAAIVPFIRSVASSWQAGSGRQEILQNGRTALEMMTRYIRQAKRITAIPGASGNYIKIRDPQDTYNIVFYHNVAGSPYYIVPTTDIKDNDLVMRSNQSGTDVNTMLAPEVASLNFIFLKDDRNPASKANEVKSMQIQISLNDPTGSISYTLALEDMVTWRKDVRESIWVINSGGSSPLYDKLTDIAYRATANYFRITTAVSNCLSIDSRDGSCWVADRTQNRIRKVSSTGEILWTVTNFLTPNAVSVNNTLLVSNRETVWVADGNTTATYRIRRVYWTTAGSGSWTYDTIGQGLFTVPKSVSVNPYETAGGKETCWVADGNTTATYRIRRVYWTTAGSGSWTYNTIPGFSNPYSVSVNPNETINNRNTCWVADTGGNRVRKIYWTTAGSGSWTYRSTPSSGWAGSSPRSVSVNTTDGTCWVANSGTDATTGNRVRKLFCPGICSTITTLAERTGFSTPYSVSVNPADDTCWVADYNNNRVVRLGADGSIEWSASGNIEWSINRPMAVSVSPNY